MLHWVSRTLIIAVASTGLLHAADTNLATELARFQTEAGASADAARGRFDDDHLRLPAGLPARYQRAFLDD